MRTAVYGREQSMAGAGRGWLSFEVLFLLVSWGGVWRGVVCVPCFWRELRRIAAQRAGRRPSSCSVLCLCWSLDWSLLSWCHCQSQSPGPQNSFRDPIANSRTPYQRKLDESSGAKISRTDFDHNIWRPSRTRRNIQVQTPRRSRIHTLNKTSSSWWAVRNCYTDRIRPPAAPRRVSVMALLP
jgi:hypothetical protein